MHFKLHLQNHVDGLDEKHWTFTPPVLVGRDPNSDLCIDHDSISRKHCQFQLNGEGALVIKDLDSMNGIYTNDRKVDQATLMPGQVVQVGALVLQVDFTDEESPAKPTRPKPAGSVYATQPMQTFKPVPLPPEKPWWKRLFG